MGYQVLVDLARENHLHYLDGFVVGVAQPVHKDPFLAQFFEHPVYLGAAAVDENGLDAHLLHEYQILEHRGANSFVDHGGAAVLYHKDFPREFFDIGHGLEQDIGPDIVVYHKELSFGRPAPNRGDQVR